MDVCVFFLVENDEELMERMFYTSTILLFLFLKFAPKTNYVIGALVFFKLCGKKLARFVMKLPS